MVLYNAVVVVSKLAIVQATLSSQVMVSWKQSNDQG